MNSPFDVLREPAVAAAVARWLPEQRWYAAKGRPLVRVRARSVHPFHPSGALVLWQAEFRDGPPSCYHIPLGVWPRTAGAALAHAEGWSVTDALTDPVLVRALLSRIAAGTSGGGLRFGREAPDLVAPPATATVRPLGVEQSNTSVVVDERYLLKVVRRPVAGANLDVAVQRLLAEAASAETPRLLGTIEATADEGPLTLAVLQEYLPGAVDGWVFADRSGPGFAAHAHEIGRTVARLHGQLAAHGPTVPLGTAEAARIGRSMLDRLDLVADVPGPLLPGPLLPGPLLPGPPLPGPPLPRIRDRYARFTAAASGSGIHLQRVHGDLHLGQLVRARGRWLVVDFEGEPAATPAERAALHPVVKDLAGMLRSFDYRAFAGLSERARADPGVRRDAQAWADHCRTAFITGYAAQSGLDVRAQDPFLTAYEIDKAVYELAYERRNRPSWSWIPLRALERLTGVPGPYLPHGET